MFRYIPYEKKKKETIIEQLNFENGDKIKIDEVEYSSIKDAIIDIYNKLYGYYDGTQTLMYSEDYPFIEEKL
jgi:hypothetical protein